MAFKIKAINGQIRTWSASALSRLLDTTVSKARQLKAGGSIIITDTTKLSLPKGLYRSLIITKAKTKESTDGK